MSAETRAWSAELLAIATEAKARLGHEEHDGWTWTYPDRILRCGCGWALVTLQPEPSA